MTDRPILFSAPMVRAILREIEAPGTGKTMTRRIVRDVPPSPGMDEWLRVSLGKAVEAPKHPAPYLDAYCNAKRTDANPRAMSENWCWWTRDDRQGLPTFRVGYAPGDRLWVKEAFAVGTIYNGVPPRDINPGAGRYYLATSNPVGVRTIPSMFMSRVFSRLTLTVTGVKVERLQEISEQDARAEGVEHTPFHKITCDDFSCRGCQGARHNFRDLWDSLNGKREGAAWADNPWVVAVSFRPELRNIDHGTETDFGTIDAAPAERATAEVTA